MSDPLSYEDFQPLVGQPFTAHFGEDDVREIVLLECTLGAAHGRSRSFSLLFRAGPDAPREQGNYLLSRENFGPGPIFLVPVRATPDGVEFHAVFNQLTEE
jgi:uncharacterized protein DUF6916